MDITNLLDGLLTAIVAGSASGLIAYARFSAALDKRIDMQKMEMDQLKQNCTDCRTNVRSSSDELFTLYNNHASDKDLHLNSNVLESRLTDIAHRLTSIEAHLRNGKGHQ